MNAWRPMRAADLPGVEAVAVSYGAHPRKELEALAPLACVNTVAELSSWLERNA